MWRVPHLNEALLIASDGLGLKTQRPLLEEFAFLVEYFVIYETVGLGKRIFSLRKEDVGSFRVLSF